MGLTWKICLQIDSESSVDVFNNGKLLTGIHKVEKPLKLHSNAGCNLIDQNGGLVTLKLGIILKGLQTYYPLQH